MNRPVAFVAPVAPPIYATRNNPSATRNNDRNNRATAERHSAMTASELRAQLRAQQTRNSVVAQGVTFPYESCAESCAVARQVPRVLASATAANQEVCEARAVVEYRLVDHGGGTLIDPDGPESAVRELQWRFGHRVDWQALLAMFEAREQQADREAAAVIRGLMRGCIK